MMKRNLTLVVLSLLAIMIMVQGSPVSAHTPASMSLSYDFSSQVLTVEVTHSVTDVSTHYIYQIVVDRFALQHWSMVHTRDYTTQDSTSGMSDTFTVPASHGDDIRVTAKCIVSGELTNQIEVIDPANTEPVNGGGSPIDTTLLIAVAVVAIVIIAVAFVFIRRR